MKSLFGTEGFWINFETEVVLEIVEHEFCIRDKFNAKDLGLSDDLIATFPKYKMKRDRIAFMLHLMSQAPLMRFRGYKNHYVFEFHSEDSEKTKKAYRAINSFSQERLHKFSEIRINNLATGSREVFICKAFDMK